MSEHVTSAHLAALGAERLAEALLELADRNDDAALLVARLASGPDQNVRRFKRALAALRRRKRFVSYRESGGYAEELRSLLADLEAGVRDPRAGVELVVAFYKSDGAVLGASDDSNGVIGDVFRMDARDLFARYAAACDDKAWLTGLVFDLVGQDDYGVRDAVLGVAAQYLPGAALRDLADRMWQAAGPAARARNESERDWRRGHWFLLIEVVARQLNDAALFERARRAYAPELGTAACTDIAAAWLAAGEAATALEWLQRIAPDDGFKTHEREELLRAIYQRLGHRDELERLVWKRFRAHRSGPTLEDLLGVIGAERRDDVVADAATTILQAKTFAASDAAFLIECGRTGEAAGYVVERRTQLDGDQWPGLLSLAEVFEGADRPLAATVLYRALLDSILARGQSRIYGHGARYLHKLGRLAEHLKGGEEITPHPEYVADLRARHGRKKSFWTQCDRVAATRPSEDRAP